MSGVSSVGFSTTQLLVAKAGASLCATMLSGWLNGVIAEMAFERLAQGEDLARLAVRGEVAGEGLAVVQQAELAREGEDVVGAADLVERVLQAEAGLQRDQARQLFLARDQQLGGLEQDLLALIARQLGLVVVGDLEGLGHQLRRGARHGADQPVVPGEAHFEARAGLDLLAGDAQMLVPHVGCGSSCPWAVSQATRLRARSKASKLRQCRPSGVGRELAIADQRHLLLGDAAMAAQRLGQAREVVPRRRGAQHLVLGRDDDEIAQPVGRQFEALGRLLLGERRLDARHRLELGRPLLGGSSQ